jgi:hypothetical protein
MGRALVQPGSSGAVVWAHRVVTKMASRTLCPSFCGTGWVLAPLHVNLKNMRLYLGIPVESRMPGGSRWIPGGQKTPDTPSGC